jgi:signal peptidase I
MRPSANDRYRAVHWVRLLAATAARALVYSLGSLLLFAAVPALWGWTPTTVMSDSMAPSMMSGDIVVSMPVSASEVRLGQVLLFDDPDHDSRLRMHRLVEMQDGGMMVTKGDANASNDSTPAAPASVHGVGILRIPMVGSFAMWAGNGHWPIIVAAMAAVVALLFLTRIDRYLLYPREGDDPVDGMPRHRGIYHARGIARIANGSSALIVIGLGLASVLVATGTAHAAFTKTTVSPTSTLESTAAYSCLTPAAPADNPFSYFTYNETSGTAVTDISGASPLHPATLTGGVSRVAGNCNKNASPYITLDGATGEVTQTSTITSVITFTHETWVKTTSTTGGNIMNIGNVSTGLSTNHDRHLYMDNAGRFIIAAATALGVVKAQSAPGYNDGTWHHVVATGDLLSIKIYVDGALVQQSGGLFLTLGGTPRVGYDTMSGIPSPPTSARFTGSLDNTAFYSTQLEAPKVLAHYNVGH